MAEINRIKLLIATGLYPPDIGGPATYSRMLEEKLHLHGVDVVILPFGEVRHLPKIFRHLAFAWNILKKAGDADVIYALDSISVGVPALLVSSFLRKPFIIRLGGDYAWEQGQQRFGLVHNLDEYTAYKKQAPLRVRFLAGIQSFVVRHAYRVIAPSEYLKSIISTWGVDPAKIRVIYSALFPLSVEGSRAEIRQQLSYNGTVITTVGRLVPWKGFVELVDTVAELRKEMPELSLIIIGDGPLHDELQKKILELNLQSSVRLIGKLGKEALGPALKGSDLFVLNTSYEGLSHQLLEVMDLGVPIITTNVGGNPELVVDGVSGLMVPPKNNEELGSAIKRMLANENLQTRMVQNAKVRIGAFSQDAVVERLAELLYAEVLPLIKK